MIRYWIIALQILLVPLALQAQDITVKGNAPAVVKMGERFRMTYEVNAKTDAPHFELPDALTVLSGPNVSQQTSFQFINGKQS